MTAVILGISTALQFIAAFLSVRLISITGKWAAWTLFAVVMTLMGVRRSITLYRTITGDMAYSTDLAAELVALAISVLMVSAVLLIAPIFRKIQSTNEELQSSEEKYREVVNFLPQIIYEADMQGNLVFTNPVGNKTFGEISGQENTKMNIIDLVIPENRERGKKNIEKVFQGKTIGPNEYTMIRKDGSTFPALVYSGPIMNAGVVAGMRGLIIDITEYRQMEEELRKLSRGVEASSSVMIITDLKGIMEYVNPRFTEVTGYTREEATGRSASLIQSGETPESTYIEMWKTIITGEVWKGEFHNRKKDGSLYWDRVSISGVKDAAGEITHFISVQEDVTHEYELSEKLSYQASHDSLTGLVNRHEFERRAERLLASIRQDKTEHALCFMDLDQFKIINDTCGHAAGDEMLRQLSMVLQHAVRKRDTLARLGGDEFGVLMEHCSPDHAHRVASTLQKAVQDYQFSWEGRVFKVGVSIGLVAITEAFPNLTELLKQADAACYMAKDLGRNRIQVYHGETLSPTRRHGEMQWVTRIYQALEQQRLCLFAQTIEPLDNRHDKHYELLLWMKDEDGLLIPPDAFLPAAERYNLIERLDAWVIEKAFSLLAANPVFLAQIHFISINLSGHSLTKHGFLDFITAELDKSGIDGKKICFEITETAAISNLSTANKFLSALKELGCQFALDDFGSGLSSFAYLKRLPVDYLKIDGMFVKDIVEDPIDRAMVKSINEIGHVMGMQTIAEFVENDEIKGMLREIGVNYAQGYGIGRPQPFEELLSRAENVTDISDRKRVKRKS